MITHVCTYNNTIPEIGAATTLGLVLLQENDKVTHPNAAVSENPQPIESANTNISAVKGIHGDKVCVC